MPIVLPEGALIDLSYYHYMYTPTTKYFRGNIISWDFVTVSFGDGISKGHFSLTLFPNFSNIIKIDAVVYKVAGQSSLSACLRYEDPYP